jgi:hypothetical protein
MNTRTRSTYKVVRQHGDSRDSTRQSKSKLKQSKRKSQGIPTSSNRAKRDSVHECRKTTHDTPTANKSGPLVPIPATVENDLELVLNTSEAVEDEEDGQWEDISEEERRLERALEEALQKQSEFKSSTKRKATFAPQAPVADNLASTVHVVNNPPVVVKTMQTYSMMPPPSKYTGQSDYDAWHRGAVHYINAVANNEEEKAILLDRLLDGMASVMLGSANPQGQMSYGEMHTWLRAHFAVKFDVFDNVVQTKQKTGETPLAFKLRLQYALAQENAVLGITNQVGQERRLLSLFKSHVLPSVQAKLANALVRTIEDAVEVASHITPNDLSRVGQQSVNSLRMNEVNACIPDVLRNDYNNRFKQILDTQKQLQALIKSKADKSEVAMLCMVQGNRSKPSEKRVHANEEEEGSEPSSQQWYHHSNSTRDRLSSGSSPLSDVGRGVRRSAYNFDGQCWCCETFGHTVAGCPNQGNNLKLRNAKIDGGQGFSN